MEKGTHVRAIHHDGVLKLLAPLDLPDGAQVSVVVFPAPPNRVDQPEWVELVHPTRLVPAEKLDNLTGVVSVGGDALADSEALYD